MKTLWGFLAAAFLGTGCGFLHLDAVFGLGVGTVAAGLWCYVLALTEDMNFGGGE